MAASSHQPSALHLLSNGLYNWKPSNTVVGKLYFSSAVFRSVYSPVVRAVVNNTTSLMDLQVGRKFAKKQHFWEVEETSLTERGRLGSGQTSSVLPFVMLEHAQFTFRHVPHLLLKSVYWNYNDVSVYLHFHMEWRESVIWVPSQG